MNKSKMFFIFFKRLVICVSLIVLACVQNSCSKESNSPESIIIGRWDCTESNEPQGIFIKDYVFDFDESGVFYNVYDGERHSRGTYNVNDNDLYIQLSKTQVHWDVEFISKTQVKLSSTRTGYSPGSAILVKRK